MDPAEQFGLDGQVAVVTGAGRGIGEGIAKVFARAGASVVVAARRTNEIERVAKEITDAGGSAVPVTTDVTDDHQVDALAQAAISQFGSLTCWVNNAGGSPVRTPLRELARDDWDNTIALNLSAVWAASAIASRHIERGTIINISSPAGEHVVPSSGHYCAAKAGVNMLTKVFAAELAPDIRVNAIAPGAVPTEIMMTALGLDSETVGKIAEGGRIPLGRLGTPDDMGLCALYLASAASAWMTGQVLTVSGGR
ncbi:MAG: glucose 1-dehydrogenase [Acidimicrobiia bacterium]|nr:glucose 1-dehydrogenase [Acidimicrobiia bacterium]